MGRTNKMGVTVRTKGCREFEGIGKTTRDAKFAAAAKALTKLKEALPGIAFEWCHSTQMV